MLASWVAHTSIAHTDFYNSLEAFLAELDANVPQRESPGYEAFWRKVFRSNARALAITETISVRNTVEVMLQVRCWRLLLCKWPGESVAIENDVRGQLHESNMKPFTAWCSIRNFPLPPKVSISHLNLKISSHNTHYISRGTR